jgi:multidrug resistance efflux pump
MWGGAALIAIPLAWSQAAVGSSPAVIEPRMAALSPIRTDHRLRISKILVKPGQSVKADEILVELDPTEIDADLAVARAKLVYVELVAGWQQLKVRDEHARTSHALAAKAESSAVDVARIVAEAERDRSELIQLDTNMAIEQKLVGDQLANAERLKAMQLQRAALAKKVEEYRTAVEQVRKGAAGSTGRLSEWRQGSKDPNSEGGEQPDARAAAGEVQRQEIRQLELLRQNCVLRAPFDGRVGDIIGHVGELSADPLVPVLTVVEEYSKTAIAYVNQTSAEKIHLGDRTKLVPRGLTARPLLGRVVALAPSITEIPIRFRRVPTLAEFGRSVYIELDVPDSLPGRALDAVFLHSKGLGL